VKLFILGETNPLAVQRLSPVCARMSGSNWRDNDAKVAKVRAICG